MVDDGNTAIHASVHFLTSISKLPISKLPFKQFFILSIAFPLTGSGLSWSRRLRRCMNSHLQATMATISMNGGSTYFADPLTDPRDHPAFG